MVLRETTENLSKPTKKLYFNNHIKEAVGQKVIRLILILPFAAPNMNSEAFTSAVAALKFTYMEREENFHMVVLL